MGALSTRSKCRERGVPVSSHPQEAEEIAQIVQRSGDGGAGRDAEEMPEELWAAADAWRCAGIALGQRVILYDADDGHGPIRSDVIKELIIKLKKE